MRDSALTTLALTALVAGACGPCAEPRGEPASGQRGAIRDRSGNVVAADGAAGRTYPFGDLGVHAIGDVAMGPHARVIGRSGVEAAWDDALRGAGTAGGHDVELTLDMDLMTIVDRAFPGEVTGAVVVVDVRDGSVRALFSAPTFDRAALLPGGHHAQQLAASQADGALVDRAVARARPPGGTMKTLTVLAGLEAGRDPDVAFACDGVTVVDGRHLHCFGSHGMVDARGALTTSCTLYASDVAQHAGLEAIAGTARDFGLGQPTEIGLRFEASGVVPDVERSDDPLGAAIAIAVGRDDIEVTPLQLAMAYAAIANGGTLWTPRLVSSIRARDGTPLEESAPRIDHRVHASEAHLAFLRDALADVVAVDGFADATSTRVAGKTGHGRDGWDVIATWFAGFAPVDDPEIAIVVLLDGSHALQSERVGVEILREYLARR